MKKGFLLLAAMAVSFSFSVLIAFAAATDAPNIDDPTSPVDANKALITGTTEPGAKIVVTGGPYELSPVYADDDGNFSITVALAQESTNIFLITAKDGSNGTSDAVQVTIVEGASAAQAHEASTGEDRTAPDEPVLDESTVTTDELTYTITGSGQAGANVIVNNDDSGYDVASNGAFAVEVDLTGNGTKDTFSISLMDDGGLSPGEKIYITSTADADDADDVDEDDSEAEADDTTSFTDIAGHWGETYIFALQNMGVISGYGDGTFRPDAPVSRAEILKIALEAFELTGGIADPDFSDVSNSDWYSSYVKTGYGYGVIEGYDDGTFRPNNEVTRAAALKIILEAAGFDVSGTNQNGGFADVAENDWFAKYAVYARNAGFVSGYEDGEFKGGRNITRAEVCKIVKEVVDLLED